ncbi:hypothetical protein RN001_004596 [Aquatica leii]|uniref:Uncharacterized protein n=1 Tax=Aquatica leii TaxID=1421715 RepID=A0AAN7PAX5_9COLE|nr:hypothetical protein RN001_004596 [Aquatica leii]
MQEKQKRDRGGEYIPVYRCPRKGCQRTRSVRHGNRFLHYTDPNGKINSKLSLCEILELIFFFILEIDFDTAVKLTGKGRGTVCDWYSLCREVCSSVVSVNRRGQLRGTEKDPVQIDEARFAGKRNYNRGKMLNGDQPAESNESDAEIKNNQNHGRRINGPWVKTNK